MTKQMKACHQPSHYSLRDTRRKTYGALTR